MAQVNPTGIVSTSLDEYTNAIEAIFTNVFGNNFNIDPETRQGQIIGQIAFALSQVDFSIIDMFNATDIYTAVGQQLDYIASNLNITRKQGQNSEVACVFTGTPGTTIPQGTKAKDIHGNQFTLKASVVITANGSVNGYMVAQDTGHLLIEANTVTQIVNAISGWDSINNPKPGVPGFSTETDDQFRKRYLESVFFNGRSNTDSIKAALLAIQSVKQAVVVSNDTNAEKTIKNITLKPHSVCCVLLGADQASIIKAIAQKKPAGIDTNGNINGTLPQEYNNPIAVSYYEPTPVQIYINIELSIDDAYFPNNGVDAIQNNILAYFNATLNIPPNQFNHRGFGIGDDIVYTRIFTPINAVPGHDIQSLTIGTNRDQTEAKDITINLNQYPTIEKENIIVTLV